MGGSGRFLVGSLHPAQAGHKGGTCRLGGGLSGTMETQRDSLSLGGWSLLLLLLGLVITPAAPQALSYEEAVLRAVDGFNQRSSEKNLYRLLHLDSQPNGVSQGGDGGEGGSAPARLDHTIPSILHILFMSGTA